MSKPFLPANEQERIILDVLIIGIVPIQQLTQTLGGHPEPNMTAMGKRGLVLTVTGGMVFLDDADLRRVTDGLCK